MTFAGQGLLFTPWWYRPIGLLLLILGLLLPTMENSHAAQSAAPQVFIVQIQGEIDLGLAPYLARVIAEAEEQQAAAVILEINTPGGRLDAVLQMRNTLLGADIPIIAFVNREAFSAGALIAIAADEIYMVPGAVMGAATPVDITGEPGSEKVISAVRSTFAATAEQRERDPRIAEAMVDPAISIEGLTNEGQLLTLTAQQALEVGYADEIVANRQALLETIGLADATLRDTEPSLAENVVRFLTNPVVASLLTSIGFLLIIADVLSGGFGGLALAGVGLFAIFFWGHFLAGLAGWEGVALVVIGIILIGVEVFLIPGIGISGILGAAALLGGIFISTIEGSIITSEALTRAALTAGGTLLLVLAGTILLLRLLSRAGRLGALVLQSQVGLPDAVQPLERSPATLISTDQAEPLEPGILLGKTGVALSDLRPGGFAEIDGERVDVVTEGGYVPAGTLIEVIADQGYRRIVRRARQSERKADSEATTLD